MQMTMRWYGPDDPVTLASIRQIPGVTGIVTALYEYQPGEVWPLEALHTRKQIIEAAGLEFAVVESIPVAEAIKLGLPERDALITNYQQSIRNMGAAGIRTLCYNFMPIFDWTRTNLSMPMPDAATALCYVDSDLSRIDLSNGTDGLPGWAGSYSADDLNRLRAAYADVDAEALMDNLIYFLEAVVPVAEASGVYMGIHPDDPPWSIFGLPRIVTDRDRIRQFLDAVPSPHNGLTFCTGSLGAAATNDLPAMAREFGDRINFVHMRNVKRTAARDFYESAHPTAFGDVDMFGVMRALVDAGYSGPVRPDHGRMIWGETGRPGYGLYDRALGAMYLQGLYEGIKGALN